MGVWGVVAGTAVATLKFEVNNAKNPIISKACSFSIFRIMNFAFQ